MIEIYALKTDGLPNVETLISHVCLQVGDRSAKWRKMPQMRAKESIGAMLLLQYALGRMDISPHTCTVATDEKGRPCLMGAEPHVDFNVTHTDGLVVCALATGRNMRVGVDAEALETRHAESIDRVAARWFTPRELERLNAAADREREFLSIWTAKEAIVKRTGEGLSVLAQTDSEPNTDSDFAIAAYTVGKTTVTLCHGKGESAPREVQLIAKEDLIG